MLYKNKFCVGRIGLSRALATVSLAMLLQACGGGGGSDVGSQDELAPVASAQVLGSSAITTGDVVVRSGSEVLLSAKESVGRDDPILKFVWRQVDSTGKPVDLIERSSNSRSFTAPAVAKDTPLQFELEVTDSDGKTAVDRLTVQVQPAADSNVFLLQDAQADLSKDSYQFVVAVEPGETTKSRFTLRIDTTAQWIDRSGANREKVMSSERIEGEWPTGVTGTEDFAKEYFNPRYSKRIPVLDVDEVNKSFESEADRDKRLDTNRIDDANIFVNFVLEAFDNNARIVLQRDDGELEQLLATVDGVVESGNIPVDRLREAAGLETRESAQKYYALIDAPKTLSQWLDVAGFEPDPVSQGGVAHARYVNNYDLGFGREMYQRIDECGNVYSFVNNYQTLESTIQTRGKFATVVMEYAPIDRTCGGDKIVKFLTYVPDEATGEDVLVTTINFDGRGERLVPGVCTACHGGAPTDLSDITLDQIAGMDDVTRGTKANLNSSFMLWDLDAFLYADDDPALSQDRTKISEEQRQKYTRVAQEGQFKALNQGALATYLGGQDKGREEREERYAAAIKLVHGWYGTYGAESVCGADGTEAMPPNPDTLPNAALDGSYMQCGWRGEKALYQSVYARNCRMCHTQLEDHKIDFDTAQEFLETETWTKVFEKGVMPMARLTYDRFWSSFNGGESAASMLAKRSATELSLPLALPIPDIRFVASGESSQEPDVGDAVFLDGSSSSFADGFEWTIETLNSCGDEPLLVGKTSATPNFLVGQAKCAYELTLVVTNGAGSAESKLVIETLNPRPKAVDFVAPIDQLQPGASQLLIDVLANITSVGDGSVKVIVNNADAPFNLAINANVVNNNNGTLNYLLTNNPFGVKDEIEYQLQDLDGSLSLESGLINVEIDLVVPVLNADAAATAVKLFWSFAASADGYNIYRCAGAGCTIAAGVAAYAKVTGGGTKEYTDSPLLTGAIFTYQISAVKNGVESGKSTPPLSIVTVNREIAGFTTDTEFPSIALTWSALSGATRYTVQRDGVDYKTDLVATGYTDADVVPGNAYTYKIVGYGPGNTTLGTSTPRTVTAAAVPDPDSVTVATGGENGDCSIAQKVTASWTALTGVQSYNVYYNGILQDDHDSPVVIDVDDSNIPVTIVVKSVYGGIESSGAQGEGTSCVSYVEDIYKTGKYLPARAGWVDGCVGCHDGITGGPQPASDEPDDLYNAVIPTYKTPTDIYCISQATDTATSLCSGSMDKFNQNDIEIKLIKDWVTQGALNN